MDRIANGAAVNVLAWLGPDAFVSRMTSARFADERIVDRHNTPACLGGLPDRDR